jgi:hypothetical protein
MIRLSSLLGLLSITVPTLIVAAQGSIGLTSAGVACDLGERGVLILGIPAVDARGTHAPVRAESVTTDGATLTAAYRPPFKDVTLTMRMLEDQRVEYKYNNLPRDARIVMCQFNIPQGFIVPGLTATFDGNRSIQLPSSPGKTNGSVRLLDVNASRMDLSWPTGECLTLISPTPCWHGVQDSRVWGKNFIGVCLTPPLVRNKSDENAATFVLTFRINSKTILPKNSE